MAKELGKTCIYNFQFERIRAMEFKLISIAKYVKMRKDYMKQ